MKQKLKLQPGMQGVEHMRAVEHLDHSIQPVPTNIFSINGGNYQFKIMC